MNTPALCPLCTCPLEHREHNDTHAYVCDECPFVGLEYSNGNDYKNLEEILKLNRTQNLNNDTNMHPNNTIMWVGLPEHEYPSGMYRVPYEYRDAQGTGFSSRVFDTLEDADEFYNEMVSDGCAS
jgi:hypothetical protein